jgi:hypothetical protein
MNLKYLILSLLLPALALPPALAQTASPKTPDVSAALKKATLGNTLSQADFNYTANQQLPEIPSFNLKKGQPLADGLPVAFLKLSGGQNFTPAIAAANAGADPSALLNGRLGNLKFLESTSVKDVLIANPQLKGVAADSIPGFASGTSGKTIATVITEDPAIGDAPFSSNVLQAAKVSDLPGISDTAYFSYPGIEKQPVSNLFGVADIGLDKVLSIGNTGKTDGLQLMKLDRLSTAEKSIGKAPRDNVSSGSNKEPNAPCTSNCSYGELRSTLLKGKNPLNGTKILIGQKLKGGEGLLGEMTTAAGIREPGGYEVPYIGVGNCGSKLSLENPEAKPGKVQQQLNFRFCYDSIIGRQATPYFLPVPIGTASEKDNTAFLPMKVVPILDDSPIKIEPAKELADLQKDVSSPATSAPATATTDLSKQVAEKIASSSLSDEQKSSVLKSAEAQIKLTPLAPRNEIIAEAARVSFAGSAVKADSTNPSLAIGGSPDAIIQSILS